MNKQYKRNVLIEEEKLKILANIQTDYKSVLGNFYAIQGCKLNESGNYVAGLEQVIDLDIKDSLNYVLYDSPNHFSLWKFQYMVDKV